MELTELLERVDGPDSFLWFAEALLNDHREDVSQCAKPFDRGARGWENETLEQFLNAAIAWASDSNFGVNQGEADDSPWKRCASFLYAGKIYE